MDNLIKCPFCKAPFAAAELVQHCKFCPQRRNSQQKPAPAEKKISPQISNQQGAATVQRQYPLQQYQAFYSDENYDEPQGFELKQLSYDSRDVNDSQIFARHRSPQSYRYVRVELSPKNPSSEEQASESTVLVPCPICSRQFSEDRIEKHKTICQRAGSRKVKKFDVNEYKFAQLSSEEQRLVHPESVQELAERKKEVEKMYSTSAATKDHLGGAKEVQLFGYQKPNFQPYSDEEDAKSNVSAAKGNTKPQNNYHATTKEFVPPSSGPIDEVTNMHIGGPRLQRTPTEEHKYESPYKVKALLEEDEGIAKKKGIVYNSPVVERKIEQYPVSQLPLEAYAVKQDPSSKHRHRHKHRHDKKDAAPKADMLYYMYYMMQMMQMQQGSYHPMGMHSMPVQHYPVYQMQPPPMLPPSYFAYPYLQQPTQPAQLVTASNMPFCVNCGGKFIENARFCGFCGSKRE